MDILRKELNSIYASQHLELENLDESLIAGVVATIRAYTSLNNGCCVITDASSDRCHIIGGCFCKLLGITSGERMEETVASSDEDVIYTRLHPEDLVEKRMLEYEFFRHVDPLDGKEKTKFKACCTIRIRNAQGNYIYVDNSTQILRSSPAGRIWLILCCYDLASCEPGGEGICPRILNNSTGEISAIITNERRRQVLSPREKEILMLIRDGRPSKQIADRLGISIHTVNRHRQNIISKLSVGSTVEAIRAASMMKLL